MNIQSKLYTLHRYFIWADRMRLHFDTILKNQADLEEEGQMINSFLYMSYWYGGLYVVIEGWQHIGLTDEKIDSLLAESDNVTLLKKYRNGVFHFQKDYFDKRFTGFMTKGVNCVEWVRNVREAFSDYFLNNFESIQEEL